MLLKGTGAASGFALGRVFVYKKNIFSPKEGFIPKGEEQSHLDRYLSIKKEAIRELEKLKSTIQKHDSKKAEIFIAHQEILDDVVINEEIPSRILNDGWTGDWAIYHVYETVLKVLKQTADPLISERAADFDDVRTLLLNLWYGIKKEGLDSLKSPSIIAAYQLMPSDTASMNKNNVLAILTETGGVTSHAAIIAKSYGIPTILGIKGLLHKVKQGQLAAVNANEGTVILDPEDDVALEYEKRYDAFRRDRQEAQMFLKREGLTRCGEKIEISLNLAGVTDEELQAASYTDSVGLFRTEFLYMDKPVLPSEEEQFSVYRKILLCYGGRPVLLRTLDIGGDKPLSGVKKENEENPFLGNRALRFCFSHPEIFKTQIRAALRASASGNLWLMLPMVNSMEDILRAKEIIKEVKEELKIEGKPTGNFKTGIMIEIPSIALIAEHAAKEVDFASIGSNDLCQYLCAADRMNNAVEPYYQSYHPALFKLISQTVSAFEKLGKPVSICGELACDIPALPVLIGLGLRKLSMGAASVASVKRALSLITVSDARETAQKVLNCATADEVKKMFGSGE
jgi:phosphotransferase system enzyme I (PtsI)